MISKSPERGTFQKKSILNSADTQEVDSYVDLFKTIRERQDELENDPKWKIDNLEYDLRSTDWILEKVRNSRVYAQNLYAAMCNNDFIRNEPWPLLTEKIWHCSWRSAGGIIADMRQEGDYIDWYCSGISNEPFDQTDDELFANMNKKEQELFLEMKQYVSESIVTDEIKQDLLKLGWIIKDS